MKIDGKVVHILEEQNGEGRRGPWRKQDFVVEIPGTFSKSRTARDAEVRGGSRTSWSRSPENTRSRYAARCGVRISTSLRFRLATTCR